jgi:hypothetical protein
MFSQDALSPHLAVGLPPRTTAIASRSGGTPRLSISGRTPGQLGQLGQPHLGEHPGNPQPCMLLGAVGNGVPYGDVEARIWGIVALPLRVMAMNQLMRFPSAVQRDPAIEVWMKEHPGEMGTIARH